MRRPSSRAHGDVLQIGVVAGQPAGHRHGLRVMRVHAAGVGVDHLRQLVGVGALELGQAAVLEDLGRQREVLRQLGEHLLVGAGRAGGGLLLHRQAELAEQDLADLLGAADVEGLAGEFVQLALQPDQALAELVALLLQHGGVDQHAVALDAAQQRGGRHLDLLVDPAQLVVEAREEPPMHRQAHLAVLARILGGARHVHLANGIWPAPLPHRSS
jgi:hypothetical protein